MLLENKWNRIKIVFIMIFVAILTSPLLLVTVEPNRISIPENRKLSDFPSIYTENTTSSGNKATSINENFLSDFETWFNDSIGFRSQYVMLNAFIKYYGFRTLSQPGDFYLAHGNVLNYIPEKVLMSYGNLDLRSNEELNDIVLAFDAVNSYLEFHGIKFYFYPCYDKQSIYPEFFPDSVYKYGNVSRADQLTKKLITDSNVDVIESKEDLIAAKKCGNVYGKWTDATHWNQEGAILGYREIMQAISSDFPDADLHILDDNDYEISMVDQGATLFGIIHEKELAKTYTITNPMAIMNKELFPASFSWHPNNCYFENNHVNNSLCLLTYNDSYFRNYIIDDFAESFERTICVNKDYFGNGTFIYAMNTFKPDIVIFEQAERSDGIEYVLNAAEEIKSSTIFITEWEDGTIEKKQGADKDFDNVVRTGFISVYPDARYVLNNMHYGDTNNYFQIFCYDEDKHYIGSYASSVYSRTDTVDSQLFATTNDTKFIRVAVSKSTLGGDSRQMLKKLN